MKYLFIIAIVTLFSCKKEAARPVCYKCTFGVINNVQHPDTSICGTIPATIKDGNGNDLSFYCTQQ